MPEVKIAVCRSNQQVVLQLFAQLRDQNKLYGTCAKEGESPVFLDHVTDGRASQSSSPWDWSANGWYGPSKAKYEVGD